MSEETKTIAQIADARIGKLEKKLGIAVEALEDRRLTESYDGGLVARTALAKIKEIK